jgi:hypothetical protein
MKRVLPIKITETAQAVETTVAPTTATVETTAITKHD